MSINQLHESPATDDQEVRYSSLASFRSAHNELVERRRAIGDTPEIVDEIQKLIRCGQSTGALLDEDRDRQVAQSLLDYWDNILYRVGYETPEATLLEFDPTLAPELPDSKSPYVGLDTFQQGKEDFFFGRQRMVQVLVDKVARARLVAVVGPSGSGKSSLVLAGLIPTLKKGAIPQTSTGDSGSQNWRYVPRIVPGSNPLANLVRMLRTVAEQENIALEGDPETWINRQIEELTQNPQRLATLAAQTANEPSILVVDQFEEVFTLCTDEHMRTAFVNNLLAATQTPGLRHTIILTMRTDFESFVVRLPEFQPHFEEALVRITPLNAAELREAIEQPADLIGLKFEAGVVNALLQDILGEPAALPLLQFTLLKLWENRQRNRITWEAYKRLGGGRLALARSADAFYAKLIPEEQVTARRILLRLVRPGNGLEFTSNRVRLALLYQTGEAPDRVDRVLQKLFDAHLVHISEGDTAADTQIEVAHEALVRNWPLLVDWLEDERETIRQHQRITEAAEQWHRLQRVSDALWPSALLNEALRVIEHRHVQLSDLETEFINASRQQIEDEQAREIGRRIELAEARTRADAEYQRALDQARTARRFLSLAVLLAIVAVLAVAAFVYASRQREQALQSEQVALGRLSSQLAVQSRTLVDTEPDTSLLVGWEAHQTAATPKTWESLLTGIQFTLPTERFLHGFESNPWLTHAMFSPNDQLLAVTEESPFSVSLWDVKSGGLVSQLGIGSIVPIEQLVFSASSDLLATGDRDGIIRIWHTSDGKPYAMPLIGHSDGITGLAFSPDSQWLASSSHDGTVRVWNTSDGKEANRFVAEPNQVPYGLSFSPDSTVIAIGFSQGKVLLWDRENGEAVRQWSGLANKPITQISFHPNKNKLVTLDQKGNMAWWDLKGQPLQINIASELSALSQNGLTVVSSSSYFGPTNEGWLVNAETGKVIKKFATQAPYNVVDNQQKYVALVAGKIQILDLQNLSFLNKQSINQKNDWITSSTFDRRGRIAAVGLFDGSIILQNLSNYDVASVQTNTERIGAPLFGHKSPVSSLAFDYESNYLASGDERGAILIWNLSDQGLVTPLLHGHQAEIATLTFSRNGQHLVSKDVTGVIRTWDIPAATLVRKSITGIATPFHNVALSSDGRFLAVGENSTLQLWDVEQEKVVGESSDKHKAPILSIAFSPNDRMLASGSIDGEVHLWDLQDTHLISSTWLITASEDVGGVLSLSFSDDNRFLAIADTGNDFPSNVISIWDVKEQRRINRYSQSVYWGESSVFTYKYKKSVFFKPNSENVSLIDQERVLYIGKDQKNPLDQPPSTIDHYIEVGALSNNGRLLALGSMAGTILLWNINTSQLQGQPIVAHTTRIVALAFNPENNLLASSDAKGELKLWNVASGQPAAIKLAGHNQVIGAIVFSRDGKLLASGDITGKVKLWNVITGEEITTLPQSAVTEIQSLGFSENSTLLAAGDLSGVVVVWNVVTQKPMEPNPLVSEASLWTDGATVTFGQKKLLAIAFPATGKIDLWNLENAQKVGEPLLGNNFTAYSSYFSNRQKLVFNSNGDRLAVSTSDYRGGHAVVIWDLSTDTPQPYILPIAFSNSDVVAMQFVQEGQSLTLAYRDGTVIPNYPLAATDNWQKKICTIANRNLSWQEWNDYIGEEVPYKRTCPDLPPHPSVVVALAEQIEGLLRSGETAAAKTIARNKLKDYPAIGVDVEDVLYQAWLQIGHDYARSGDFDQAIKVWQQALSLKSETPLALKLEPLSYLQNNAVDKVLQFFQKVHQLAPNTITAPELELGLVLLTRSETLIDEKQVDNALQVMQQAIDLNADMTTKLPLRLAHLYGKLCWRGSLAEKVETVFPACERAVELATNDRKRLGPLRDVRGVAKALRGDFAGAAEDFQYYIEWAPDYDVEDAKLQLRKKWIEQLNAGQNPFDSNSLKTIENEYQFGL